MSFHDPSMALTSDAARHPHVFANAFNSGDLAVVERMYEPDGILVASPGQPVGGGERAAANQRMVDAGAIDVRPRHVYVVGDLALLVVDWRIDGGPDGTATDVARRGVDGLWRYVIDNPFGTARVSGR